ncbi:glycosyltransferase family 4 protein [Mariprofundus erugo]|uniref:Glycosyltransferase family 4 protein n=1 Tax=Mariprofundus erugo TaxID=2528639 RepID=A0A5R9GU10_9PROT|nr:glycosyltransferase [Mariprofundus erugo]TLS69048.1 glycosyltransferase family 4 protein [Mariprofundus erugo]
MIKRVCIVVASEMTIRAFLIEQIRALSECCDVTVVVKTNDSSFLSPYGIDVDVVPVAIERNIHPWRDLTALWQLFSLFRKRKFDLVHSVTPKAGLLAMLAARLAGVRYRIHTFTGQVWATRRGFSRLLLKSMDRLLAASASHLLADSHSQRRFLLAQGVTRADKLAVLAEGSISGVDSERFRPDSSIRAEKRRELGLADEAVVLLFLGRLNRDKGILDLSSAFAGVAPSLPELHLLLVGPDEGGMKASVLSMQGEYAGRVHCIDYTDQPEAFFAMADIFCLPSYREGFGSVIIEAAACGLPAIGSRIYGISDAIAEGRTGLLFEAGDHAGLAAAITRLTTDADLRRQMGATALLRARSDFSTSRLVQAWLDYYDGLS